MSLNQDLEKLFSTFAAIMEIRGESAFKAIAFSKVSRILKDATFDIKKMVEEQKLNDIPGIGKSSAAIIQEYVKTGRSTDFEEVAASVPPGLIPLLEIPGLGPKTISLLWKERGITNHEELVKAIDSGSLAGLKGVGEKKIETIKQGIALRAQGAGRMGLPDALAVGRALLERLKQIPEVKQAELAGSVRRRRETIGDVDLVAAIGKMADSEKIGQQFVAFPEVQRILGQGTTKISVLTTIGLQVDLRMVPVENFGAALLYFTGSKDHNVELRGRALDREMTLNEWGLYKLSEYEKSAKKTGQAPTIKPVASKTEVEVYHALELPYIEPEMRESRGEIAAADAGQMPRLITLKDIKGDLHSHTTASDGQNSIEQMAEAAIALGYKFLAITDHSKSQAIANGLTAERLIKHIAAIHKANDKIKGIRLLAGCEVDILADGHLDFEDDILAQLDIVVASPHVALKQDADKATDRILRAIDNKYVNIIGHPTGRLIDRREGLPLNFEKVFAAAAANGTALEINAGYPRLDLNDIHARAAVSAGVTLAIDTDAHSGEGFDEMELGIDVARRAWVEKSNVINCLSPDDLLKFIGRKR